jgi:hypothetical protein
MEDLLENFSKHINKIISSKLGTKIRNLARAKTYYKNDEDYAKLESNIQMLIESYLSNLKDNDYKEIANNIFNSFIEEDDKNLIKAINFYKRTYEHYQEMNLRRKFYKWRTTALKLKMINNFLIKENFSKDQNSKKPNLIKTYNSIIPKLKYENNIKEEKKNIVDESINQKSNYSNFNNNKSATYEINNYNNIIDRNSEEFNENKNKYNNQKYRLNFDYNNNDDYKEECSEELDYNKLYSKINYV